MLVAIFDRDDTLSITEGYSEKLRKADDLSDYDKAMVDDPVHPEMVKLFNSVPDGVARAVVTGRRESARPYLEQWLAANDISPDVVLMRADGDRRKNAQMKSDALDELLGTYDGVLYAVDDNPKTIKMYRERGVLVMDAAEING